MRPSAATATPPRSINQAKKGILSAEDMRRFRETIPQRTVFDIALIWVQVLCGLAIYIGAPGIATYVAALLLIGGAQHGMTHVMHEAAHFSLFPKSRRVNDFVGSVFYSLPVFIPLPLFRYRHFVHHRVYSTMQDPKTVYRHDFRGSRLWIEILRSVSGYEFLYHLYEVLLRGSRRRQGQHRSTKGRPAPSTSPAGPGSHLLDLERDQPVVLPHSLGPSERHRAQSLRQAARDDGASTVGRGLGQRPGGPVLRRHGGSLCPNHTRYLARAPFSLQDQLLLPRRAPPLATSFLSAPSRNPSENPPGRPAGRFPVRNRIVVPGHHREDLEATGPDGNGKLALSQTDRVAASPEPPDRWWTRPIASQIPKESVPRCPACESDTRHELYSVREHEYDNTTDDEFVFKECDRCGAWYLDPRPAVSALDIIYPPNYYTNVLESRDDGVVDRASSGLFSRVRRFLFRRHFAPIIRHRALTPDSICLDIGCGSGISLDAIHQSFGIRGVGIDYSEKAAQLTRARGFEAHACRFEEYDPGELRFDLVHSSHVIEHVASPLDMMKKSFDLLKPGGLCVFFTPNPDTWEAKRFGRHWGGLHVPRHWTLFGPESARENG